MGTKKSPALTMPDAVPINIQGIPCVFVDVPRGELPTELHLSRLGELVPFKRGQLAPGVALLVLPPEIADHVRSTFAKEIAKAKAATAATGGPH